MAGRTVVVGFDGVEPSVSAARWAAVEARRLGCSLQVVSVADPPPPGTVPGGVVTQPGLHRASRRVAERGAELARSLDDALEVRSLGVVGGPSGELVALSGDAAFLVVGRHPTTGESPALGSVSFAVAMHAWCPVVVVPEGRPAHPGPDVPVVVGVDGSRASEAAVEVAAQFAHAAGAPLRVVSAWQRPKAPPWPGSDVDASMVAAFVRAAEAGARARVERAVAQLAALAPDAAVSGTVAEGAATDVLVDASGEAGLVVVGSRGHGGFAGLALGSVGHGVLRGARSPVAVVRRGAL
jgi:nucleotide-binding universal stress UspA family protein